MNDPFSQENIRAFFPTSDFDQFLSKSDENVSLEAISPFSKSIFFSLQNPQRLIPENKMVYVGMKNPKDREDLIVSVGIISYKESLKHKSKNKEMTNLIENALRYCDKDGEIIKRCNK